VALFSIVITDRAAEAETNPLKAYCICLILLFFLCVLLQNMTKTANRVAASELKGLPHRALGGYRHHRHLGLHCACALGGARNKARDSQRIASLQEMAKGIAIADADPAKESYGVHRRRYLCLAGCRRRHQ